MSIKHAKHAAGPDVAGYEVVFSDWNADHVGSPLTVTDGTTSVADVTQETFVGATVAAGGAGEAIVTVPQGIDYVQDTDPGAVGAGKTWLQLPPQLAPPTWVANAEAIAGTACVIPTVPNGHWYVATDQGLTGLVEPTWPTDGSSVLDGAIHWQDQGLLAGVTIPVKSLQLWRRNGDDAGWTQIAKGDPIASGTAPIGSAALHHYVWGENGIPYADWSTGVDSTGGSHAIYVFSADLSRSSGLSIGQSGFFMLAGPIDSPSFLAFNDSGLSVNAVPIVPADIPTADEKAALDNAPTPLTALNPVASVADLPGPAPSPATTVTGPDSFGASAVVGTGTTYARADHDHGLPAAPYVPLVWEDLF
jgi:hypothetical protein